MSSRKFSLRWSRCSGSTKRLVERCIRQGWEPGKRFRLSDEDPARHGSKSDPVTEGRRWNR